MNRDEIIVLYNTITSICKDAKYIATKRIDVDKIKKINEDLEYVKDFLEDKLIEFTSIGKQKKSLSDKPNTTDRQ